MREGGRAPPGDRYGAGSAQWGSRLQEEAASKRGAGGDRALCGAPQVLPRGLYLSLRRRFEGASVGGGRQPVGGCRGCASMGCWASHHQALTQWRAPDA